MTKQEIINRIAEIEDKRFYLSMKDRWNNADYDKDRAMLNEMNTLKSMLKLWEMRG